MTTLVIGYGNDLRSDDGAGRVVAERIEGLHLPGVTVRSQSQLTPELALEIATVDRVIFVDASVDVAETSVADVEPARNVTSAVSHFAEPAAILRMAATVGKLPERAHAVSIPVTNLDLGSELSAITRSGVETAVALVTQLAADDV